MPMTTFLPHTHIRLRDLSELVAGIPYVIGFPPTDSLVLFTFRRCPDLSLSTTIRVDLPKPEHVELVATEVAAALARNDGVAAIAVVIAEAGAEHRDLINALRMELDDNNILLSHASWVARIAHGELWQCYDNPLCTDTVPDPQSSALAAATAVAGDAAYANREAMAASLAADPEEALERREKLLDAYRMFPAQPYTEKDLEADLDILRYALDLAANAYDLPTLSDHQLVRLARALSQPSVKDECIAITLSEESGSAEHLWTLLVRAFPAPERAEPAFLLAMSAYLRGSGVMAALALQIVMKSNPLHQLAVLVDYALRMGVPPGDLREVLLASVLRNNEKLADPDPLEDDDPPWDTSDQPDVMWTEEPCEPEPSGHERSTTEPPAELSSVEPSTECSSPEVIAEQPTAEPDQAVAPAEETGRGIPFGEAHWVVLNDSEAVATVPGTVPTAPLATSVSQAEVSCLTPDVVPLATSTEPAAHNDVLDGLHHPAPVGRPSGHVLVDLERFHTLTALAGLPAEDAPASTQSSVEAATGHAVPTEAGTPHAATVEPPRVPPGPLSQRSAAGMGVLADEPVQRTAVMDALTAFLPLPTDQRGPG